MIRDLFKWVVPGLATALGGTTLCLAMTAGDIAEDLAVRSDAAMKAGGFVWAELALDARDLTLTGTTTDVDALSAAVTRLESLPGLRSVRADVILAPLARPYRLVASIDQDAISLAGGVPDETMRHHLLERAGLVQDGLELRSGMPERQSWLAGAEFAIDQLQFLDQGQVEISDLTVNLSGRARSERAMGDLLNMARNGLPDGLTLGTVDIKPALATPYHWNARFDGTRIEISGYVPDEALLERYRTADIGGLPVATGLALGSGEPADFAVLSRQLLEQLARLEYGEASITDGETRLSGAPPTPSVARSVIQTLAQAGSIVTLDAPRIADYWMSATRQPGGVVVFDGYAPDEATRQAFGQLQGADVSYLQLGRGAPERYRSGVDFGLAALDLMSEGRIALRGNLLTLSGIARSSADYDTLLSIIAAGAPQGVELEASEIVAPRAELYEWSASKATDGTITLAGLVPDPETEVALLAAAGEGVTESMAYASGAPRDFLQSAETGIELLKWVEEGRIVYDGRGWTLTGNAKSAIDKAAVEADFVARRLVAAGWSMAVADPLPGASAPEPEPAAAEQAQTPPPVEVAAPAEPAPQQEAPAGDTPAEATAVDPDYAFSASRNAEGTTILSGQVPNDAALRALGAIGNGDVAAVSLADGAPPDFQASAETGLRALQRLTEGQLDFAGGRWSLRGVASDSTTRDAVLAALDADPGRADWAANLELPASASEAEAAPVAIAPVDTGPADISACVAQVADFSARNAILFQSGAAIIAAESQPALDELARYLSACPDAVVHVEGHTDSDGDEALNLALSVARAEAVIDELVTRGIGAARFYALGYGEALPVADNATAEGKRLNRRIVVTVQPTHF